MAKRNTFFLGFLNEETEREFQNEIRSLNQKIYQVFVLEKPSGIWEIQKWIPDTKGLSTYLNIYKVHSPNEEGPYENCWDILMHKYINSNMKKSVIFSWKQFDCEKQLRTAMNERKSEQSQSSTQKDSVVQFPHKETA